MRRVLRPLLLLTCSAVISPAQAAAPTRAAQAKAEARSHAPRRAHQAPVELASATRRQSSRDRACPLEQPERSHASVRTHRTVRGDSLTSIAFRYGTSVRALAAANGLEAGDPLRADRVLVVPQQKRAGGGDDWLKYARAPKRTGELELYTYTARFRGPVVVDGKVVPAARSAVSELLGIHGSRPALSERLLRLLVRVSDTFGGRPVRVVSGYRVSSYFADSRHRRSEAIDFSIPGVPNAVVRQYLLLLDDVGVGYYPNSSFLHLDVRSCPIQWVDYAGPGEPPRRSPRPALPLRRLPRVAQAELSPAAESGPEAESEPESLAAPPAHEPAASHDSARERRSATEPLEAAGNFPSVDPEPAAEHEHEGAPN